jgi:radical SAM-linked protein
MEAETPDCRWGDCMRCGIPGDGLDTQLALPTLPVVGEEVPALARAKNAAYRLRPLPRVIPTVEPLGQPERLARYRFTFQKLGDARWLSHRNVMDLLERALRAAAVPVRYTEGYNPHVRLSMGPALSLGYEALAERFDVECHAQVEVGMLSRANRVLPEGLQLTACEVLPAGARSLGKSVSACRYRLRRTPELSGWPTSPAGLGELAAGVLEWQLDCDELRVTLNARQADGPTPSVKALLAVLGIPEGTRPRVPVVREGLIFASMSAALA